MWVSGHLGPDDFKALLELVPRDKRDQHLIPYPKQAAGSDIDPEAARKKEEEAPRADGMR